MNFKAWNNRLGWLSFVIAAITYLLTAERQFSFWDCGEYIVSSSKLGVTHAPGAAFFQLLGAVWSGLAMGNGSLYGIMINSLSAICSAFTILFLFWTITHMARKLLAPQSDLENVPHSAAILLSGFVGALAFTFSDTFWFSAVEGEVYAMASMFTALLLWLICKWENESAQPRANRWLVLISLLVGLSTGVHLMAILVVPAICYIYYFKKFEFTWKSFLIANAITLVVFYLVFKVIFSATMSFLGNAELFFVNQVGLPYNSGTFIALAILAMVFYFGLKITQQKKLHHIHTGILCVLFMLVGFSSWMVIPIRANANPHMNLNDPDDALGLLDYFNREQYGNWPVFSGPMYTAHIDPNGVKINKNGTYQTRSTGKIYKKGKVMGKDKYVVVGDKFEYVYADEHIGPFARMYNPQAKDGYESIMGPAESYKMVNPETGEEEIHYEKPTLGQNIQFFINYQIGYMYLRYFAWNFIGRQNDLEGQTEVTKGNFVTGVPFIDNQMYGDQDLMPHIFKNKAHNVYFAIPLIIGLIGFFFQLNRDVGRNFALISLFLLTGVGIILYTNVKPFEPRERDYALVSSFYAFAIWIGLGVAGIYFYLKEKLNPKTAVAIASISLIAPILMGAQNWDDHDRSGRSAAYDLPYNYLVNLDPNAILFVYGDNDTYPLWTIQETENFRDDVKIVNFTLLSSPWNIEQVKRKTYNADPVPSQMTPEDYKMGVNEGILVLRPQLMSQIVAYAQENEPQLLKSLSPLLPYVENGMTAKEAMDFVLDKNNPAKKALVNELRIFYGDAVDNVLPTNRIHVPVNKENVLKNGIISTSQAKNMVDTVSFDIKSSQISYKSELMMLDILANYNWDRSINFSVGGMYDDTNVFYLNDYLEYEGFTYKFVPIKTREDELGNTGTIDALSMYEHIKNYRWGNFNDPNTHFTPTETNNILTYRNTVIRTVEALIEAGEKEKALELLDLCQEKIPYERYTEGFNLVNFVTLYLELGEKEKAEQMQQFLEETLNQEEEYYKSLSPSKRNSVYSDISRLRMKKQYMVGPIIEYYLDTAKDTAMAKKEFLRYYHPLEQRIDSLSQKVETLGFQSLTDREHEQLSSDLQTQEMLLPLANQIDSTLAKEKLQNMIENMDKIDPR